jgi:hypothetical protein
MTHPYEGMTLDPATVAAYLDKLAELADKGERCLTLDQWRYFNFKNPVAYLPAMAYAGHIRIEISLHNYRTVYILKGQHAGKSTRGPDNPRAKPYVVIGGPRP